MFVRVRIGKDAGKWRTGHKPLSLLCSVLVHGGLVALAFLPPNNEAEQQQALKATIVELTHEHKVIWYDFRQELPEVSATNATAKTPKPGPDAIRAKQNIVVAPNEKPGKQFVYLPAPQIQLQTDLKAPNLIALSAPAVPKLQPKAFQAPELKNSPPPAAPALPAAPAIAGSAPEKQSAEVSALLNRPTGPPPKQFLVPNAAKPLPAEVAALPSAPTIAGGGNDKQNTDLTAVLNRPGGPPPKAFTPPPARNPAGGTGTGTGATALPTAPAVAESGPAGAASLAIIGLNPSSLPQIPAPEGSRPARITAGTPTPGAAELGGGNSPISVPDVSVQGGAPRSPATAVRGPQEVAGQSQTPAVGIGRTPTPQVLPASPHISVPQWPNTRSLPALVERHFPGRVVYVTLVPVQSGDDWIIWFGELTATPVTGNPVVRPPAVLRTAPLPPFPARTDHGAGKIRVTGIIRKDGHLDSVSEATGGALDREWTGVLQTWLFSPATRNNAAIDADTVIEIPVSFGALSLR